MMVAAVMSSATPHLPQLAAASQSSSELTTLLFATALGMNDRASLARMLAPTLTPVEGRYSTAQFAAYSRLSDQLCAIENVARSATER